MQIQRQFYSQEQRLKMNPQLYQSIKLLELPVMELRTQIEQELERNPALEIIEDNSTVSLNESEADSKEENDDFDISQYERSGSASSRTSEEHRQFIEGALIRPETLQEHLLWQLQIETVDIELRAIAETLIQNLDDDGFHKEKPETLFDSPQPRLWEAAALVRRLDPTGTCTCDYHESLKVQISVLDDAPPGIEKVLDNLELLKKEKFSQLEKITDFNKDELRRISKLILKLSPFPGRQFTSAQVRYVVPDIKVFRENDKFSIILNDEIFPVLGISKFYEELGDFKETSSGERKLEPDSNSIVENHTAARDFARKNVREARLFINHLNRRGKTLVKVTNVLLNFQQAFFLNGPKYLAPLTLSDIAKELNVHETTIFRTANGKYIQTEWGIYEIRYFFSNSISGAGSSRSKFSKESVKEIIKEIISFENKLLSDQDISAHLTQKGIALARRTVAKYRKELDMGSSYTRGKREKILGGTK
jgi:RNA polymerase sigma-54 factor